MSTMKYTLKNTPIFVPLCPVACQRCLAQDVSAPVEAAHESKWPSPAYPNHRPLYPVQPSVDGIAALVYLRFEKLMNWVFDFLESSASKFIITWATNLDLLDSPSSALTVVLVVQICCWLLSVWYLCAGLLDCKDVFRLDTFVSVYILNCIYIREYSLISNSHRLRVGRWDYEAHCWNTHGAAIWVLHIPFWPTVTEQGVPLPSQNWTLCHTKWAK